MSGQTKTINCTNCGAGQSVLGGGRVTALVCGYCGSVLDAQDNFKVLAQNRDLQRPDTPFEIGQTGQLFGVKWTIIGTLGVTESYRGKTWTWVDHQLFSPTHGYCFLTWEDGHCVFTRKVRGMGNRGWYNSDRVERAENQPVIYRDGERFRYYESGSYQISFAEGSFNWVPKIGDSTDYVSFLGDSEMLTHAQSPKEKEVELSSLLPRAETLAAFGAEPRRQSGKLPPLQPFNPLRPYTPWRHTSFARTVAFASAVIALVMGFVMMSAGNVILQENGIDPRAARSLEFTVTNASDLLEIRLVNNAENSWAWYDLELLDPAEETVAEFGRTAEYYSGYEDGESWSEGSRSATATLRLAEPGTYTLFVEQSEAGVWTQGRKPTALNVTITEGKKSSGWMFLAMLACLAAGAATLVGPMWHNSRRWSGSDWSDD